MVSTRRSQIQVSRGRRGWIANVGSNPVGLLLLIRFPRDQVQCSGGLDRGPEAAEHLADRLLARSHPGNRPPILRRQATVLLNESPDGRERDLLAVACDVGDVVGRSLELVGAVLMPSPWVHKVNALNCVNACPCNAIS